MHFDFAGSVGESACSVVLWALLLLWLTVHMFCCLSAGHAAEYVFAFRGGGGSKAYGWAGTDRGHGALAERYGHIPGNVFT